MAHTVIRLLKQYIIYGNHVPFLVSVDSRAKFLPPSKVGDEGPEDFKHYVKS